MSTITSPTVPEDAVTVIDSKVTAALTMMDTKVKKLSKCWTYLAKAGAKNISFPDTADYNGWCFDHLQKECTARGFWLERVVLKGDRIKHLRAHDEMKDRLMSKDIKNSSLSPMQQTGTMRTKYWLFWLLNILFHDKHLSDSMKQDNTMSKYDLDTRKVGLDSKSLFWNAIHADFVDDAVVTANDEILCDDHIVFEDIEPSNIVEHSVVKLEDLWKNLNSRYKKAIAKFTQSGNFFPCFQYRWEYKC